MAKSDGSVIIDTRMDTSGFGKGIADAKQKVSAFSGSLNKLGNTIKNTFSKSNTAISAESYKNLQREILKTEERLNRLIEKQIRFVETGGNIKSRTFAGMEYDISRVSARLEELRAKKTAFDSLSASEQRASENSQMLANTIGLIKSSFANLIPNLKAATKNMLSFVGRGVVNGVKKIGTSIKKMATSLLSVGKNARGANKSMLKMLATSLLFSTVFRTISALINSFKDGINNLVLYSDEANASMSALKSATSQLKNSLATAFMPLITFVTPALVSFINTLSKAFNMVGAFFSALSGKSTYTKAVAVQEDYAAGLKETSKNAKDAKKSLNQYLSGLDEIRTFTEKQNEEDTQEQTGISPQNMFTEEAIPSGVSAFADKIKEIFENLKKYFKEQDWKGLGKYLASGVNKTLQFLYDALNWEKVKEKIVPFIKGLTETFNSFVDNIDWNLLGKTIGAGINTLVNILYELITGIDWKNLGIKIGESINGLFSEIDWTKAGETLGEAIKGLLDLIIGFLESTDWQQIGNAVADFIGGVDWSGITNKLFEGIGAALGGLTAFLWGLIEDAWNEVVTWWKDVAFEDGKFTMQGLLDGIWEVAKNIGTWLMENVINPIIDGFKKGFGIHSPSTVMAEMGGYIMLGLLNGIKKMFSEIESALKEIKNIIVSKFTDIKENWNSTWDSFADKVKNVWSTIEDTISSAIDKIKGWISDIIEKFNDAKSKLSSLSSSKSSKKSYISSGIYIPNFSNIKIPKLATGAVIPPNAPFMAMLGDQRHGTNIEAPIDTIKQAVREVVGNGNGGGGQYRFSAQINRRVLFEEFIEEAKLQMSMTGHNPLDLRT